MYASLDETYTLKNNSDAGTKAGETLQQSKRKKNIHPDGQYEMRLICTLQECNLNYQLCTCQHFSHTNSVTAVPKCREGHKEGHSGRGASCVEDNLIQSQQWIILTSS